MGKILRFILPCPKCGGKRILFSWNCIDGYSLYCSECLYEGEHFQGVFNQKTEKECYNKAMIAWNKKINQKVNS
jgi:hypothetical protein